MGNTQKDLLKKALEFSAGYANNQSENLVTQDHNYMINKVMFFKDAAKAEGVGKSEYGLALVAFILNELNTLLVSGTATGDSLVADFVRQNELPADIEAEIIKHVTFLSSDRDAENKTEELLRDTQHIHLGLPDALEKIEMQRAEEERVKNISYSELEWLERSKQYFITHSFNSPYTIKKFGVARSKNFMELEKRIDKLRNSSKDKNSSEKTTHAESLSDKEGEDMFKLAFRNSVNLISVADRKAGMLIQINTLLAGFVFTLGVSKFQENPYYLFPTAAILIGSALTIFFGILASRPINKVNDNLGEVRENFFFGSYDRLDSHAGKVSWEKYSSDINELLKGDKKFVFDGLIRESYEVSKVLSKKFGYLSLAYKIFFAGLVIGIIGFLILIIYEYNFMELQTHGVGNANPF